ncbi:MAG TPA: hypothetical protein EYN67_06770 [Flavobacteriales bacterium]|nr:hypothetical protein [Flavobacteriales bacterium]
MKYEIIKDCLFNNKGKYLTIKKGSLYTVVPSSSLDDAMKLCIDETMRHSIHTERWIVLDAEGQHRMFCIGKDCTAVYPKSG